MMRHRTVSSLAVLALTLAGCEADRVVGPGDRLPSIEGSAAPRARFEVVEASGDLTAAVAEFRVLLGDPANGATPGQQPSGRREIRRDGVPAELTNNDAFPADFLGLGLAARAPGGN